MRNRAEQLVQLTEVAYAAKQTKLAALARTERELSEQLSALDSNLAETQFDPFKGAYPAGAELRWKAWNEREKVRLNLLRAQVRSQKLAMRDEVARLFGRYQAAQSIVEKLS